MNTTIRKAVIPAAGLGTRFLPATKSIPKEMLTVVDKPILLYVVEEAVRAGIEDIILIQGRGKGAIEDFFDTSVEVEAVLERSGKLELLESIRKIKDLANIISVRQKQPLGLGHAVYSARPVVGDEPFALLLGDEIMVTPPQQPSAIGQLTTLFQQHRQSVVAIMDVPLSEVHKYGIVAGREKSPGLLQVERLVEKPDPGSTPSQLAIPGRYVFSSTIFQYLKDAQPGKNGEIQLTDAMVELAQQNGLLASRVNARRFDAGDRFGYLQANLELAIDREDLRPSLIPYLQTLVKRLGQGE